MRNRSKLLLTALTASVVLGALVGAASANRIALSNRFFRATWTALEFTDTLGVTQVKCPVTIEGSFHSTTISKVLEALVGYVTKATVGSPCTEGTAIVLQTTLPWHIRYAGFTAANGLPAIESIKLRLVGAGFLIMKVNPIHPEQQFRCLYKSTEASPMIGVVNRSTATGEATNLTPEAARIPLFDGTLTEPESTCFASGGLKSASNTLTLQGNTTKITVTLVA